jgi:SAM-dependent methyltransferase
MTFQGRDELKQIVVDPTFWENVNSKRWGAYISEIERRAILRSMDISKLPATALELGCEGGRWLSLLTTLGWSVACTDVNEEVLKVCKKRIPAADCILVKPHDSKVPYVSSSVDLLLCIEVAPVIQSAWFIEEACRLLRKNGLLVGVCWNRSSFRGLYSHIKSRLTGARDFYSSAYPAWRKKLVQQGFSIIYEEGFCWFPFGRASDSILIPYCVRIEKFLGLPKLVSFSPWIVFIARKTVS